MDIEGADLASLTVRELRDILVAHKTPCGNDRRYVMRQYDLRLVGPKRCLVARVVALRAKVRSARAIQRMVRGLFARLFLNHRGLAGRARCVNSADFCTLEPTDEIPFGLFFGYADSSGFTYGFNIMSLVRLARTSADGARVLNPYTRAPIPWRVVWETCASYRVSRILFPQYLPAAAPDDPAPVERAPPHSKISFRQTRLRARMAGIRRRPLEARIGELFAELNRLGYCSANSWFEELCAEDYMCVYDIMFDIWKFRLDMPNSTRLKICPVGDPFVDSVPRREIVDPPQTSEIEALTRKLRESCVFVAENLVMACVDREYQTLGAMYFLTALTHVSAQAREELGWLYYAAN